MTTRQLLLVATLCLAPLIAQAAKMMRLPDEDHAFCDIVANMAPDWMEQHQQGSTVEEISAATEATVKEAGIDLESDHGVLLITAANFSLISIAQQDPASDNEAQVIAFNTCGKWLKGRGRIKYKISDQPLVWD